MTEYFPIFHALRIFQNFRNSRSHFRVSLQAKDQFYFRWLKNSVFDIDKAAWNSIELIFNHLNCKPSKPDSGTQPTRTPFTRTKITRTDNQKKEDNLNTLLWRNEKTFHYEKNPWIIIRESLLMTHKYQKIFHSPVAFIYKIQKTLPRGKWVLVKNDHFRLEQSSSSISRDFLV